MNTRCVDEYDPPVRTIEQVEREQRERETMLRAQIAPMFRRVTKTWAKRVYSDQGRVWPSMQKMAESLRVDRGTGYVCVKVGVRCRGHLLSYSPFPGVSYTKGASRD